MIKLYLKCRLGRHKWEVPVANCGGEDYRRHGIKVCKVCKAEDHCTLHVETGEMKWIRVREGEYK